MNHPPRRLDSAPLAVATLFVALAVCLGCDKDAGEKTPASVKPAKVEKLPVETDLATITLTEDADRRLGITTIAITRRAVSRRRTFGGQAVVPSGKSIIVTAPLPGIVSRTQNAPIPTPGTTVGLGQSLLSLTPLLSAERDVPTPAEQVQLAGARANLMAAKTVAAGDVDRGGAEVDAANIAFDRAKRLFADRAGAKRAVDDAEAQLNITTSTLEAAKERDVQLAKLLKMLDVKSTSDEATPLSMTTPIDGLINRMDVSEGQTVSSGSMLFEVINLNTVWIRVPVFVDLLREVQSKQTVRLVSLSGDELETTVTAKPIAAPPTADATSSSADLYYEVDNRRLGLRPGQRIGVELPMSATAEALTVPVGSILYDIHGNTWVYTETGQRQYTRTRVTIRFVDGDEAVLLSGPEVGTQVVVDGSAELFGTEFGAGK